MPPKKIGESVTKKFPIVVSRKQVEEDIDREMKKRKGMSQLEAAYRVKGHAHGAIRKASADIGALVRKANGYDKLTDKQMEEYERLCFTIIEPEMLRVGHCQNIIAKLTKSI